MVAILLANAILTPDGKPETDADIDPAQIGVVVYTISVIALVAVTVCELEPLVRATVKSFPHRGLFMKSGAEDSAKSVGSDVILDTHQPSKS
jgi:hypothetical protein